MKNITYKYTDAEYALIAEAKTKYLNMQGMPLDEAEKIRVEDWIYSHIWDITEKLMEKPPGWRISRKSY